MAVVELVARGAHEPLTRQPWSADRASEVIEAIATDARASREPDGWWPVHPLDERTVGVLGHLSFKVGAAGILWALDALARRGFVVSDTHDAEDGQRLVAAVASETHVGFPAMSLWGGNTGVLLSAQRLAPSAEGATLLLDRILSAVGDQTNSVIWGSPGAMLAAEAMLEWTGEERWRNAWTDVADHLWSEWRPSTRFGCHLWAQREPGGSVRAYLGAIGLAGNAAVLAHRRADLGPERAALLDERAVDAIERFVIRVDGLANWAPWAGLDGVASDQYLIQWCHGAPGIICSLADIAPGSDVLDELLVAGGELTWRAGPRMTGPGLCCGTSGAGFAFLKLYSRTGDERWLTRARAFAMHAVDQIGAARARYGRGRFSLWTGDIGAAFLLAECLTATARLPTIDLW